jgi:hypothetical protein
MFFWECFSLVSLILIVLSTGFFGVLVFLNDPKNKVNILCSLMNVSVIAWAFSWSAQILSKNYGEALFWARVLDLFSIFISLFFMRPFLFIRRRYSNRRHYFRKKIPQGRLQLPRAETLARKPR